MTPRHDVIIIGSGPAGTAAAFPLVEAGLAVLMVDAGHAAAPPVLPHAPLDSWRRRDPGQWRLQLGEDFAALGDGTPESPKLKTPYARRLTAAFAESCGLATEGFSAFGTLAPGGLSLLWGAAAFALGAAEMAEWPFAPDALAPSYRAVAARMGIAGLADDDIGCGCCADIPLLPPVPLSANPERLLTRYRRRRGLLPRGFALGRAWTAVRTAGNASSCDACSLCLWGCPRGAVWNAATDLDCLRRHPNFTYRPGLFVTRIANRARLRARSADGQDHDLAARAVMVAAGTLGSTRLILDALGRHGQPVRLLSNPIFAHAFVLPERIGAAISKHGFSMQQLSYCLDEPAAFGSIFTAEGLPPAELAAYMPFSRAGAIRAVRHLLPAMVIVNAFLPGHLSANTLTVTPGGMTIRGGYAETTTGHARRVSRRLRAAMTMLGALPLPGSGGLAPAGADVHYAGTLPMGGSVSAAGEVAGLGGIYAVDGAVLPALPAKNLTLTIMANADRVARLCAARLTSGEHPS